VKQAIASILLVGLLVWGALLLIRVERTSVPRAQRLCGLGVSEQQITIQAPLGHHFNLVIGKPQHMTNTVSGSLQLVVSGETVFDISFSTRNATEANWLTREGLAAYVVTLPIDGAPLLIDGNIKQGENLTFHIRSSETNALASLWLCYLSP
jgi:hypothetical protein